MRKHKKTLENMGKLRKVWGKMSIMGKHWKTCETLENM